METTLKRRDEMKNLIAYCRAHDCYAFARGTRLYAIERGTRRDYVDGPTLLYTRIVELEPTFRAVRIFLGY